MVKGILNQNRRNLDILINMIMALIIKGGALFVSLFTMPAYMRYFSNQVILGVWFTILSVLSWILTFDLGIGNGLRNKLVDCLVENNYKKAKEYISSAYIIITLFALVIALLGLMVLPYMNWNSFFNVSMSLIPESILLKTVRIVFLGILIQFVLRIITSILYALQSSFIPNLLNLTSTVMLLAFILNAKSVNVEYNIIMLAYANVITANLPLLLATIAVFCLKLRDCIPSLKLFKKQYAVDVMKLGGVFFWLQIMGMVLASSNEYLITLFLNPHMVVDYQIYNKIFTLGGTLVALVITPIWSAVTKAKAENDYIWIKKLKNKLMLLGVLGISMELMIVPIIQIVINFWLGDKAIKANYLYATIFGISGSLFLWTNILTSMSNGLGELKIQLIFVTIGSLINIPLAYIGANLLNSYIAIIIANIVSLTPYCIIQTIWINSFIKRKCKHLYSNCASEQIIINLQ